MPVWLRPSTAMAHGNTKGSKTYWSHNYSDNYLPKWLEFQLEGDFRLFLTSITKKIDDHPWVIESFKSTHTWADNFQTAAYQKTENSLQDWM